MSVITVTGMRRLPGRRQAAWAAACVLAGAVLAWSAGPAAAAPSLSVSLSASGTGASAVWNPAGNPVLTVGTPSATTFAQIQINSPPTPAPADAPTFTTNNYQAGSPHWFIQFSGGDSLFGYPSNSGLGGSNWQVIPASSGACHSLTHTPEFDTYINSLVFIQNAGCGGTVTAAGILADGDQAAGTSDTITNISYDGEMLVPSPDVVTVTDPGTQNSIAGRAISTLQIEASSSKGDAIASYAATGLPTGLSIDASSGAITGTPTADGNFAVTVTATDNGGTKGSASFAWLVSGPVITRITPDSGPQYGDTPVRIIGTDLACPPRERSCRVSVSFGGRTAPVLLVTPTEIFAVAPPGTGTVDVTVTVGGITSQATPADHFTYMAFLF
ncbi:MAG: putative Ig domain-containing protein [Streptosporangiaceae bacterium]